MGRALLSLRSHNIAVVGSGFASFHNIAAMRNMYFGAGPGPDMKLRSETWNKAVTAAVLEEDWEERGKKIAKWRDIPGSFEMQPKGGADHFMPLIVCAGAAGEGKGECFKDNFAGLDQWSYYWT
jgi:aromatic ring-opening dioxygenase catalytic subunit (LigB family)